MIQTHMRWKVAEKKLPKLAPKRLVFEHKDSLTIAEYMDQIAREQNKIDGNCNGLSVSLRMWHFVMKIYPEIRVGQWSLSAEGDVFVAEQEVK